VVNWVSSPLSFLWSTSTAATYIFTAPTCRTTIITLERCALNDEFQHFMLRCNKISLLCRYLWKRDGGEREGDFLDNFSVCRIPCDTAYFLELALKRFHPGDFPWKARRTAKGRRIWEQPRRRGKRVLDGWSTMIPNCLIESLIAKIRPFSSSVGCHYSHHRLHLMIEYIIIYSKLQRKTLYTNLHPWLS
jgi:hypothetical protein